jgi:hypothetical protein
MENNDVVLSPRLISAARIQPKNELIVETVVEDDEDDDNEGDDDEEPNIMDSMETRDVAAIWRGDPCLGKCVGNIDHCDVASFTSVDDGSE